MTMYINSWLRAGPMDFHLIRYFKLDYFLHCYYFSLFMGRIRTGLANLFLRCYKLPSSHALDRLLSLFIYLCFVLLYLYWPLSGRFRTCGSFLLADRFWQSFLIALWNQTLFLYLLVLLILLLMRAFVFTSW